MDPEKLPPELVALAAALDIASCRPSWAEGWGCSQFLGAPFWPLIPNAPPFDGVRRASWVSPGVCLRLDLSHPAVPAALREALLDAHPAHVGEGGAFYEYGIESTSQATNRQKASLELGKKVADALKKRID
jgi:hypothetical protein